jgi:hypothetical protein
VVRCASARTRYPPHDRRQSRLIRHGYRAGASWNPRYLLVRAGLAAGHRRLSGREARDHSAGRRRMRYAIRL